jgi:hypothetical protein
MLRFFFLLVVYLYGARLAGAQVPLAHAHAHNDYEHPRPLADALAAGFTSIEADVHLVDGELRVAHDRNQAQPGRTLRSLYLEPLRRRVDSLGGRVYAGYAAPLYLMIDFKTEAKATYAALKPLLAEYAALLTQWHGSEVTPGPVLVFISGNRPVELLAAEPHRLAALDGRIDELNGGFSPQLMPVVSERYGKLFGWNGQGEMPPAELAKLQALAAQVNAQGKRLRFWATPERPELWRVLLAQGVGLVGTDRLAELAGFLRGGR